MCNGLSEKMGWRRYTCSHLARQIFSPLLSFCPHLNMTGQSTRSARGGRGGGRGSRGGRGGASTSRKRAADLADSDDEFQAPMAAKKPRNADKPDIVPRALSSHSTRVINPGKPDIKKVNRTHAEVEAEKAAKAEAEEGRERRRQEAMDMIAAINAEADAANEAERQNTVLDLFDLSDDEPGVAMDVDAQDTPGEPEVMLEFKESDFERIEDDEAYYSAGDFDKPRPKVSSGLGLGITGSVLTSCTGHGTSYEEEESKETPERRDPHRN